MINIDADIYNADWAKRTDDIIDFTLETLGGPGSGWTAEGGHVPGGVAKGFKPASDKQRKALGLPPGWTHVHINPDPDGDLIAVGKDSKGRTTYRRTVAHSEKKAAQKFARLTDFNKALPALRSQIVKDLNSDDPATREAAMVLYLVEKTGFRIGGENELADVKAYGTTTLQARHVKVKGDTSTFKFIAKKGVEYKKTVVDAKLATEMTKRSAAGGHAPLFDTDDDAVRDYMHKIVDGFTPKDFRTWHGTSTALKAIKTMPVPKNAKELKEAKKAVATIVSEILNNTPAVALSSYIDPAVFATWKKAGLLKAAAAYDEDELMQDFLETVSYDEDVDWTLSPELGEEDDSDLEWDDEDEELEDNDE